MDDGRFTATELRFGRFRLDLERRVLLHDGEPVRLGPRATELLLALVERRGSVVGKEELFELVWPGRVVEENNLQQHISALRKLFGPQAIATVPGRDYLFALAPDGEAAAAPSRAATVPAAAPLIGRETELAELRERVRTRAVVTVVGPGGIGKTRLALAVAHGSQAKSPEGPCVVELAGLAGGEAATAAVAQALGVVLSLETAGAVSPAQTIATALRSRDLLLVLDNCEHVLDAVAVLVDSVRQQAPGVRVLATSQEPLHVQDEQVYRLAPLDVALGAVPLFVARAQAADHRFAPTPEVLEVVADICRRLDGLPLAIELTAARVPLLGVHGLLQRLDERLGVLGTRAGRGPSRQQTMRAALSWSHALLTPEERIAWRALGIFVGGFSLDLAQRVLAHAGFAPESVLDHLGALVDKSLLLVDAGDDAHHLRYRLLEPARAFALVQLEQADELEALRLHHAKALCELLQVCDHRVVHETRIDAPVRMVAAELENLRACIRWLVAVAPSRRDARLLAITLAGHADWLWSEVDSFGEGLRLCRLARGWLDDDVPLHLASRLRLAHPLLARTRTRPAAEWAADAPLAVQGFRQLGDPVGLYRALCALGGAPRGVVDDDKSIALLHEAEQLERPDWSPALRRRRQAALEWCHDQGGRQQACREAGLGSVALAREAASVGEIAALGNLADTEFALGLVDEAIESCRRAIAVAAALRRPEEAFNAFQHLVPALLERGDRVEAEAAIRQGRTLLLRCLGSATDMLMPLALLAFKRGERRLAVQLIGCADRARATEGLDLHSPERRIRDAILSAVEPEWPAADVAALLAEGARWNGDEGFARGGVG